MWGCSEEPEPWFQADATAYSELPELTVEAFQKAARSLPRRTASTWDGFHPRHNGMLGVAQAQVAMELLRLVERIGVLPTVLQAIFAKLIPKHKGDSVETAFRAIGLLPSLYRQWARVRREEARK